MKKYVIATLILILVPLYIFDVYMHNWTRSQLYHTMKAAFPLAQNIDTSVGDDILKIGGHHLFPTPMLPPLIFSHHIPQVSVKILQGTNLANIPLDYWEFRADSISFDSNQLFNNRNVLVKDVSNGNIQMAISARSLGNVNPGYSVRIDEFDNAYAAKDGHESPLHVNVSNGAIVFHAGDTEIGQIPTKDARLLPCTPDAKFVSNALMLTCTTTKVPGALLANAR
jgi:hypothetical protein